MRINMRKIYCTLVLLSLSLSIGCEGSTCADGIVYDAETNMPLDSVLYKRLGHRPIEEYTDSTGTYDMCGIFGGCAPDCPDVSIEFSKPGYVSQSYRNPGTKNIYLEKED